MDFLPWLWDAVTARYERAMEAGDPRVADWLLMQSPFPTLGLCVGYLVMCYVGPRLMAKREPFQLQPLIIVYNLAMVLLSVHMFYEFFMTTYQLNFNYWCDLVVYSTDHYSMRLASVIWLYYFSKIIEFLDTLFFILRKRDRQITVLHVYHHCTMVALWWIGTKWYAGGASFFSAMVNCFIHIIMYSYYLLSAFGPSLRPFLWWKRYLTMLQLAQFMIILLHVIQALYSGCGYDVRPMWALVIYTISYIALFSNFYIKTYTKQPPKTNRAENRRGEGLNVKPVEPEELNKKLVEQEGLNSPQRNGDMNASHRKTSKKEQ